MRINFKIEKNGSHSRTDIMSNQFKMIGYMIDFSNEKRAIQATCVNVFISVSGVSLTVSLNQNLGANFFLLYAYKFKAFPF